MSEAQRTVPTETDSYSSESAELRKPHEMIVMVPRSNRVTLTGRRIYNALLQVSQARLAGMGAMPPADYMFEAPLPAILRTSGSSGEDRTAAKRYLKEMRGLEVDWESTAPGDGVKWRGFSMLSEVAIEVRNGENWVLWSYPPTIMAALRDPARWALIPLNFLAAVGTYAASALYEICARYRDNPSGLTSRKPSAWWVDALSPGPGAAERREWRKFKNERIKPAIEDINSETDLEIELIEHKQGRAVVEVQFSVRKRRSSAQSRPVAAPPPVDAGLVLRAAALGVRELKFEGLIKEFGEDNVRKAMVHLEKRVDDSRLPRLENVYSYLRSLLRNGSEAVFMKEPTAEPPQQETWSTGLIHRPAPSPAPAPKGLTWTEQRIAAIKGEIQALSPEQRQALGDEAVQVLTSQRLMSAVIARRAKQGDILHGLLGAHVVRIFASRMYGPDWDSPHTPDLFEPTPEG